MKTIRTNFWLYLCVLLSMGFSLVIAGCNGDSTALKPDTKATEGKTSENEAKNQEKEVSMEITSDAFEDGGQIPSKYTCDGEDISPPLTISDVPESAACLALVMDDPDAPMGTFDHWLVWNIPADTEEIAEGEQPEGVPGRNNFGNLEYGGPCPPSGTHTYRFKLYALDTRLDLDQGASKEDLEAAMEGHIVADTMLRGDYSR